ncbi:unnamed protein product [Pieris brassicae]|uniref:Glucuronosyltransferase n=1 Tax=Pieris brassicae TaxID=7116 RepID=A0A9P0SN16_PIEBR|nr:unnamed protein product [Pieris brassicae]
MEAVTFGKPIVAIPVFADHRSNAAAVEAAGIGVILPISDLQENNFVRGIEIVLSQRVRERARLVSSMWHDREQLPLDTAVYWTERIKYCNGNDDKALISKRSPLVAGERKRVKSIAEYKSLQISG